jgi:hypothetical protein
MVCWPGTLASDPSIQGCERRWRRPARGKLPCALLTSGITSPPWTCSRPSGSADPVNCAVLKNPIHKDAVGAVPISCLRWMTSGQQ